jgi:hypothetical protein
LARYCASRLRSNIHLAVLNKNDAPLGARFVANSSGRLAIMAESPARAVKSLLQHAFAERTDFPRKWTRLKVEDVCGFVRFRASIVPKRFT